MEATERMEIVIEAINIPVRMVINMAVWCGRNPNIVTLFYPF